MFHTAPMLGLNEWPLYWRLLPVSLFSELKVYLS